MAATTEPANPFTDRDSPYGIAPRLVLAALSLSAGVVHLVFVPAHMSEWTLEGVAFAVVGWLQILMAIGLLMRPSRGLLKGTVLLNAVVVLGYIVSRTSGLAVRSRVGPRRGGRLDRRA